ncbi:MAG: response regulator transcription factor [Candidatus Sumerlaeaceae bacterium]
MRLLLVEDSRILRESLCEGLRRLGHAVDSAGDGEEGLWLAECNGYDVIILDLMLPKLDGLSVLRRLRRQGKTDHVLILTAKDAVPDRVAGLDAGADDYLPKPFEFDELLARIRALVRRSHDTKSPVLELSDSLSIDTVSRTALYRGEPLPHPLTAREYALLELLALNAGKIVSRTEIEQKIYDERAEPMSNVVDVAICTLRRKIDVEGSPSLIVTRRGMGYLLQKTVKESANT